MPETPRVVIVMPAYNAAKTLERTYADVPQDLIDHVILVDDVSKDETVDIARMLLRGRAAWCGSAERLGAAWSCAAEPHFAAWSAMPLDAVWSTNAATLIVYTQDAQRPFRRSFPALTKPRSIRNWS
jgi:cellulose synthase/poly-beta-1,6-N-acetylglucosamine synthase-like glycosyltransferase